MFFARFAEGFLIPHPSAQLRCSLARSLYPVMELLEGATVRGRLAQSTPPVSRTLEWAHQFALGPGATRTLRCVAVRKTAMPMALRITNAARL